MLCPARLKGCEPTSARVLRAVVVWAATPQTLAARWTGASVCPACGAPQEDWRHRFWDCPAWASAPQPTSPHRLRRPKGCFATGVLFAGPALFALRAAAEPAPDTRGAGAAQPHVSCRQHRGRRSGSRHCPRRRGVVWYDGGMLSPAGAGRRRRGPSCPLLFGSSALLAQGRWLSPIARGRWDALASCWVAPRSGPRPRWGSLDGHCRGAARRAVDQHPHHAQRSDFRRMEV